MHHSTSPGTPAPAPTVSDGKVLLQATLTDASDSDAAAETVRALRDAVGPDVLIGGVTAIALDTNDTAQSDLIKIIPIVLAPNITKDILNRSLYDYLQGDLGIVFGDNRQTVRAVKPDDNDKQYLHCSNEDPVLEVSKVMFLERGSPLEYSVVHHRYDMVEMSVINVSRDGLLG